MLNRSFVLNIALIFLIMPHPGNASVVSNACDFVNHGQGAPMMKWIYNAFSTNAAGAATRLNSNGTISFH